MIGHPSISTISVGWPFMSYLLSFYFYRSSHPKQKGSILPKFFSPFWLCLPFSALPLLSLWVTPLGSEARVNKNTSNLALQVLNNMTQLNSLSSIRFEPLGWEWWQNCKYRFTGSLWQQHALWAHALLRVQGRRGRLHQALWRVHPGGQPMESGRDQSIRSLPLVCGHGSH